MKTTYNVSEISSILGVAPQTLRKYEKYGIIQPTRMENNYRQFEAPDVTFLFRVRLWRNMGFSFKEIMKLVDHNRKASMKELYQLRSEHLESEIAQLQMMLQCAKDHLNYYNEQESQIGLIKVETSDELLYFSYRQNRTIMKHYINNELLTDALKYTPPFRYFIMLPPSREEIIEKGYCVGLAAPSEQLRHFPKRNQLEVLPPCKCITIMIQHKFSKENGKWENVLMDKEFERNGVYQYLENNGLKITGSIFGLTYFDDMDERYYYQSIKYYFPIQ